MIEATARSGLLGIEPIFSWMGPLSDAALLKDCLDSHGIKLAALVLALPWNESKESDKEREQAEGALALLRRFPEATLCLVQLPTGRHDLRVRHKHLLSNLNHVAQRAADVGIRCSFHPNSPADSITRTPEDYKFLLKGLDARHLGWTPDVGHLANGGMDPLAMMRQYSSLINLVHYKDWDGQPEFCEMGTGKVDFAAITDWLVTLNFKGWIICEDESPRAIHDPDGVTLDNGTWVRESLLPRLTPAHSFLQHT
jgi:inosose dehydratase